MKQTRIKRKIYFRLIIDIFLGMIIGFVFGWILGDIFLWLLLIGVPFSLLLCYVNIPHGVLMFSIKTYRNPMRPPEIEKYFDRKCLARRREVH